MSFLDEMLFQVQYTNLPFKFNIDDRRSKVILNFEKNIARYYVMDLKATLDSLEHLKRRLKWTGNKKKAFTLIFQKCRAFDICNFFYMAALYSGYGEDRDPGGKIKEEYLSDHAGIPFIGNIGMSISGGIPGLLDPEVTLILLTEYALRMVGLRHRLEIGLLKGHTVKEIMKKYGSKIKVVDNYHTIDGVDPNGNIEISLKELNGHEMVLIAAAMMHLQIEFLLDWYRKLTDRNLPEDGDPLRSLLINSEIAKQIDITDKHLVDTEVNNIKNTLDDIINGRYLD